MLLIAKGTELVSMTPETNENSDSNIKPRILEYISTIFFIDLNSDSDNIGFHNDINSPKVETPE